MDRPLAFGATVKSDFACLYLDNKAHSVTMKEPNMRLSMNNFPPD